MTKLNNTIIDQCKEKLISAKADVLNQLSMLRESFVTREKGGDEVDQSINNRAETEFLVTNARLRRQIFEIESALNRIHKGTFGVCEITGEPIEAARLQSLPWTRLSVEGAELLEQQAKRQVVHF